MKLSLLVLLVIVGAAAALSKREADVTMRDGCRRRLGTNTPGCRCDELDASGKKHTKFYDSIDKCVDEEIVHDPKAVAGKKQVNDEIKEISANLKDGCYPRPGNNQGCRCSEKDANGHDVAKIYNTDWECRTDAVKP